MEICMGKIKLNYHQTAYTFIRETEYLSYTNTPGALLHMHMQAIDLNNVI